MYCPNCGAQNPETATTCGNCGFNLKGAAAPKFKGTMLMMNTPVAGGQDAPPGGPPGPPSGPSAADAAAAAAAARRQMKGTIVGIAPPAPGAAPAPEPIAPPVPDGGMSFAPPGGGAGVNPMGSTFVADGGGPAFPPPSPAFGGAAFGAPPATPPAPEPPMGGAPFGAPAGGPPFGGAPAGAPPFGGAPGAPAGGPPMGGSPGYGAPDYGAPPGAPAYGPPPGDGNYGASTGLAAPNSGYGAPPGAMMPTGPAPMVPMGNTALAAGPVGTIRNPVVTFLITMVCFIAGFAQLKALEDELNAFVGNGKKASILWFLFPLIPILGMPKLIGEARAKAGTPVQGDGNLILYLLLGSYMIPNDANQIWQQLGARQS